jgi:hypothetical protein
VQNSVEALGEKPKIVDFLATLAATSNASAARFFRVVACVPRALCLDGKL